MNSFKQLFKEDFWSALMENLLNWLVSSGPKILLILFILFILLKLSNALSQKIRKLMLRGVERVDSDNKAENERRINTLVGIVHQVAKVIIWVTMSIILLNEFGLEIGPILASAGILGLAVGFGAQELVRDFISGFFILLEDHIRVGDVVNINGIGGSVERIQLRTIILRDFSGTVHVFQNGKINSLANMSKVWSAAVLDIGVAYKENVDRVIELMKEVGEELANEPEYGEHMLEPMEVVGVDSLGESSVNLRVRIKTKPMQQWRIGREYRKRIKHKFDKEGVEIPFPQRTLHLTGDISSPAKPNT